MYEQYWLYMFCTQRIEQRLFLCFRIYWQAATYALKPPDVCCLFGTENDCFIRKAYGDYSLHEKMYETGYFFSNDSFLLNIVKPLSVLAGAPDSSG